MGSIKNCQTDLRAIGYGLELTGYLDKATRNTIIAFQRHWLPNLLTGKFDIETAWRIRSLLDKLSSK
jgi:N-acetyl-anhydromuramyl-L-alanine amidase AmpD